MCAVVTAVGIVNHLEIGVVGGTVLLRPVNDLRVQIVPLRMSHRDVHAKARGDQQRGLHRAPGTGQRTRPPTEEELFTPQRLEIGPARPLTVPLGPAHHVGQRLAGMEAVVRHVDDGHVGPFGVFQQHLVARAIVGNLVLQDTNADSGDVTGHHLGRVLDRLPGLFLGLEPARRGGHKLRVTAQLGGRRLEREPRAHRGVVKEHQKGLVFQNARPAVGKAIPLHPGGQFQRRRQLLELPVLRANKITSV